MASPKSKKQEASKSRPPPQYRTNPPRPGAGPPEVVDPIWLLKAIGVMLVAALLCGYGSLCFLLYQGQWQLILHPKRTAEVPATISGTPVEAVRFGTDESGTPQRTGWIIPVANTARYARMTILYLPSGDGSLVDSIPTLQILHDLGVNIFAVDYRGYGQSAAIHPSQDRMMQDADAALQFLTVSRALPEKQIVPYGIGLGTSLAVHLAISHPGLAAVILDAPAPDPLHTVLADPRTHFLPVRALFHDRFPLAEPLSTLRTPKLLIQPSGGSDAFKTAANPKITISELPARSDPLFQPLLDGALTRFFDQYTPQSGPQQLVLDPPTK